MKLKIASPRRALKKALRKKGKRKVGTNVTYTPTGNSAATKTRKAKLIKKKRKQQEEALEARQAVDFLADQPNAPAGAATKARSRL